MANIKISEAPSATTLAGTELIPLVQGGINKKSTVDSILLDKNVVNIPVYSLSTMPSAAGSPLGSKIRIPRSEFTYVGGAELTSMPAFGIILQTNGTNWVTPQKQLYAQEFSTKASPLVTIPTGTGAVEANVVLPNGNIIIPSQLLFIGFNIIIHSYWGKGSVSGAGSYFFTKIGPSSTVISNPTVGWDLVATGTNKQQEIISNAMFLASNSITWNCTIPNHPSGISVSGTLGGYMDAAVTHNFSSNYTVSFSIKPGTGGDSNTDYLFGYKIFLEV